MRKRLVVGRLLLNGPRGRMRRVIMTGGARRFEAGAYKFWTLTLRAPSRTGGVILRSPANKDLLYRMKDFKPYTRSWFGTKLWFDQFRCARPSTASEIRIWMRQHPDDQKFLKSIK